MRAAGVSPRRGILFFKYLAVGIGAASAFVSVDYIINEYSYLGTVRNFGFVDIVLITAVLAIILSSVALVASLPSSLRVRFPRIRKTTQAKPAYGFTSMLAVGLGATLGSPLFILI